MKPSSPVIPGYDLPEVVYAKDQPEYQPLPVVRIEGPEGQVVTRWALSEDERARIAAGQDVYLWICTFGKALQPVLLEIKSPDELMAKESTEWPDFVG